MYFLIENEGVAPIEGFTKLGVSTARGNDALIGQFGSGNKHAILCLLREGLNPTIFLDKQKLHFFTEPADMNGHRYSRVMMQYGTLKPRDLDYSLEFGALDWTHVDMALREFVSNAIDQAGPESVRFSVVEHIRAKRNTTRVFVPLTPDVQKFFQTLKNRFLQFNLDYDAEDVVLDKNKPGPANIYRKGVFVREVQCENSLFDYNFGKELKIDESRNLDDYAARTEMSKAIAKSEKALIAILRQLPTDEKFWEATPSEWMVVNRVDKAMIQRAWQIVYGDAIMCNSPLYAEFLTKKGFKCVTIANTTWYTILTHFIKHDAQCLTQVETKGNHIVNTTPNARKCLDTVWKWLVDANMTTKKKPQLACFSSVMNAGTMLLGYYENGVVYINVANDTSTQTMLEECTHYITGAADNSRDFQDFAFMFADRLAKIIWE